MKEILINLCLKMGDSLSEKLKPSDICYFEDGEIDVLSTIISIKKTDKDFYNIAINGSISSDELNYKYDKKDVSYCFDEKLILNGSSIKSDRVFITHNGLFETYKLNNYSLNNVFKKLDEIKFSKEEIKLKVQEKIWCVFLLVCGADSKETSFNTATLSSNQLQMFHNFLKVIEKEFINRKISLGKTINWEKGKETSFRGFITTNKNLPKSQLYFAKPRYCYYLDLSSRKNVIHLLNLILSEYRDEFRVYANQTFYDILKDLEFLFLTEYGGSSNSLNKFIIEELTN